MSLEISSFEFKFKYDEQFCLGPISLRSNEHLLITGANGSGKTTLLKAICGIFKQSQVEIKFLGQPFHRSNAFWSGARADHYGLTLTVAEFLQWKLNYLGKKIRGQSRLSFEVLPDGGRYLKSLLSKKMYSLSTGQKKIVSISIGFLSPLKLLVLDEPEANLDQTHKEIFYQLLKMAQSSENKKTVCFSSHILSDRGRFSNLKHVNLSKGQMVR